MSYLDQILENANQGNIKNFLLHEKHLDHEETINIANEIVKLHNDNTFNLNFMLSEIDISKNEEANSHTIRKIYNKALSHLQSPISEVINCINHLSKSNSYISNCYWARDGLINYFKENCKDLVSTLEIIKSGIDPNLDSDLLVFFLTAYYEISYEEYIGITNKLLCSKVDFHRKSAIESMFLYSLKTQKEIDNFKIPELIKQFNTESSENIKSELINVIFWISQFKKDTSYDEVLSIIPVKDNVELFEVFFNNISHHQTYLNKSLIFKVVKLIHGNFSDNTRFVANLDLFLYGLLNGSDDFYPSKIFFEFIKNNQSINIDLFSSFSHKIAENPKSYSYLLTKLFLSKEYLLSKIAYQLISQKNNKNLEIEYISELNQQNPIKAAKKAFGWLFTHPITIASYLVSILKIVDEKSQIEVEKLLFDPLLISYPGELGKYLDLIIEKKDPEISHKLEILKSKMEQHFLQLRQIHIPELFAPLSHYEQHNNYMNQQFEKGYEEAPKGALTELFFSNKVHLLYSNKIITQYTRSSGKAVRSEHELHSHSFSMEFPQLETLDPINLNYMLYAFRNGEVK
ncbi:hypothetical protein [Pseudoalteromonas denitrificans]|uniref:Uncharacterized protein n=1 Tax=Pseudoalteromonas denitrificans DSM 6059 TaxID=1123010 RepID=A0A1I1LUH0_9GAMM|nr:hypothetical protein [Pseudoalteromonas denitrificans]SFC73110.1 hypothetical protein SAMN02745724_02411 [Pseudoalteromonas denitrificans DSM 6059]